MGMTIAGMENRKVTKMKIAFTIAAATIISRVHSRPLAWESYRNSPVKGHWARSRFVVTLLRVGVSVTSFCVMTEKPMRSAPVRRKRKSDKIKVKRILSTILSNSTN
jgi:hypothetical protein